MEFRKILGKMKFKIIIFRGIYGHLDRTAKINNKCKIYNKKRLFMYEETVLDSGAVIMNTRANFTMKKWSVAAIGLTVITGNHMSVPGLNIRQVTDEVKDVLDVNNRFDREVVVEEEVWIGSNVTLLSGVTVSRGSIIGAGSVVRSFVPPYAIVVGNPAKVTGFRFSPDEIIEHEKALYQDGDRLSKSLLEENFENYYLRKQKEVRDYKDIRI